MSTNHHTPITPGASANAATFNNPMAELDEAISNIISGDQDLGDLYAAAGHLHDDRYTTTSVLDAELAGKSNTGHTHPEYALAGHTHPEYAGNALPPGVMMDYGGTTAPSGWLMCYGQAVSRTTYAALFAVIGVAFGAGDGSTTFNLPDLRGRTRIGLDNMGGSSANRVTNAQADVVGGNAGSETHTLSATEIPSHRHTLNANSGGTVGNRLDFGNGLAAGSTHYGYIDTDVGGRQYVGNTGGGGAHNNMQPYLALNAIIKT